jgi:hypothetical protein
MKYNIEFLIADIEDELLNLDQLVTKIKLVPSALLW